MLDIGFRPDIEKILRRCPQSRQTLLLSATIPPPVKRLAERYMRDPEMLDFSPKDLAVETIEQFYFTVDPERKFDLLVQLLEREQPQQAIVFCRTETGHRQGRPAGSAKKFDGVDAIHGDLQQRARDRVMRSFRDGKIRRSWWPPTWWAAGIDVTQHLAHHQLRHPPVLRRLRAPRRPHRPDGPRGRRLHLRHARGRQRADADRDADQPAAEAGRDPGLRGLRPSRSRPTTSTPSRANRSSRPPRSPSSAAAPIASAGHCKPAPEPCSQAPLGNTLPGRSVDAKVPNLVPKLRLGTHCPAAPRPRRAWSTSVLHGGLGWQLHYGLGWQLHCRPCSGIAAQLVSKLLDFQFKTLLSPRPWWTLCNRISLGYFCKSA